MTKGKERMIEDKKGLERWQESMIKDQKKSKEGEKGSGKIKKSSFRKITGK